MNANDALSILLHTEVKVYVSHCLGNQLQSTSSILLALDCPVFPVLSMRSIQHFNKLPINHHASNIIDGDIDRVCSLWLKSGGIDDDSLMEHL